jgi:hypothetical protein
VAFFSFLPNPWTVLLNKLRQPLFKVFIIFKSSSFLISRHKLYAEDSRHLWCSSVYDSLRLEAHKPHGPPVSVTWLQLLQRQTRTGTTTALTAETRWSTRTRLCALPPCDVSLGSLTLPAPEPGDFVELVPAIVPDFSKDYTIYYPSNDEV